MTKPLILIPFKDDKAPFPLAQGSSSVTDVPNDDAIQIEKKRKADELLDGSEDGTNEDENGQGKDIAQDDAIQI